MEWLAEDRFKTYSEDRAERLEGLKVALFAQREGRGQDEWGGAGNPAFHRRCVKSQTSKGAMPGGRWVGDETGIWRHPHMDSRVAEEGNKINNTGISQRICRFLFKPPQ